MSKHLTCCGERGLRLMSESIFPLSCLAVPALSLTAPLPCLFGHVQFPTINKAPASNTVVEPGDHCAPLPPRPRDFHLSPARCSAPRRSLPVSDLLLTSARTEHTKGTGSFKATFGTSRLRRQLRGCQLQSAWRCRQESPLQMR